MRIISLADAKTRLSSYIDQAQDSGPIVITRNGKAVAVLVVPVDDDDLEDLILARSPRFQAILAQSQKSLRVGKGIAEDAFWQLAENSTGYDAIDTGLDNESSSPED